MLWSTTLTAGKPENVEAIFSLNITQATLGKANGERHFVKVTYLNPVTEENITAVVAVLQTGHNENVALNLVFDQGETFTLSSTAQIFLTGYYVTDMDEDEDDEDRFALPDDFDEDDDEDLDEDLEDDESESEEEEKIKEIPVAAPPAKKQAVGQGNVPKAVPVKEAPKAVAAAPAAKAAPAKAAAAPAAKAAPAPAAKAAAPVAAVPAAGEGKKKKKKNKKQVNPQ
mmetsp:Transcript_23068/g.38638  ORF Transcript_23068/g.38638 Transcript_23068/m.38638 type:complete len:227 (-) Transcript_23068:194-874(-)